MFRRLLLAASCLAVFASWPARAAETQPGDSCAGQTDLIRTVGGPENPGTGYLLVCDGAVWKAVNTWDSASGKSLFQVNTDAGSCTATKLGRLRYDGTSTWEYCNGTSWTALPGSATANGSTGYVQFKSSTGSLSGNSNLFWNDTQKWLGIGTSPSAVVDIVTTSNNLVLRRSTSSNGFAVEHTNTLNGTATGSISAEQGGNDTTGAFHAGVTTNTNSKNMYSLIGLRRSAAAWSGGVIALSNGDYLPGIGFAGQTNTTPGWGMVLGASILGVVDNTVSSGNLPSALVFHTSATNAAGLAERMRITSAGNVGIGTSSPAAALDVNGAARIGNDNAACNSSNAGSIRYSSAGSFDVCNGTAWTGLVLAQSTPGPTAPSGSGYFVLTGTAWNGNLGGLAGADAKCLTELTTNTAWRGYATANSNGQLTASKVKSFLCSGTACNGPMPLATYYFAAVGNASAGGTYFTTDSGTKGPIDGNAWNAANAFATNANYWSNRANFSNFAWGTTYNNTTTSCTSWTSNSAAVVGDTGNSSGTGFTRWRTAGDYTCDQTLRLICFVNP